jgi:hypothetical protein
MSVTITTTTDVRDDVTNVLWGADEPLDQSICRMMSRSNAPMILVNARKPRTIIASNAAWIQQCGFGKEAIGNSPTILQGELTDMKKAAKFRRDLLCSGDARTTLVNYTKSGRPFAHAFHARKITSEDGRMSYYITESKEVDDVAVCSAVFRKASVEQSVAVALALLLTCGVIASQMAQSPDILGITPILTSALDVVFATQNTADVLPVCACILIAFGVTVAASLRDTSTRHSASSHQVFSQPIVCLAHADVMVAVAVAASITLAAIGVEVSAIASPVASSAGALLAAFLMMSRACLVVPNTEPHVGPSFATHKHAGTRDAVATHGVLEVALALTLFFGAVALLPPAVVLEPEAEELSLFEALGLTQLTRQLTPSESLLRFFSGIELVDTFALHQWQPVGLAV